MRQRPSCLLNRGPPSSLDEVSRRKGLNRKVSSVRSPIGSAWRRRNPLTSRLGNQCGKKWAHKVGGLNQFTTGTSSSVGKASEGTTLLKFTGCSSLCQPRGCICSRTLISSEKRLEILTEDGRCEFISRDVIVKMVLVAHTRPAYIGGEELLAFEREDMKRRSSCTKRSRRKPGQRRLPSLGLISWPIRTAGLNRPFDEKFTSDFLQAGLIDKVSVRGAQQR